MRITRRVVAFFAVALTAQVLLGAAATARQAHISPRVHHHAVVCHVTSPTSQWCER